MEWYNIIALVLGCIGGSGGIVSLFTAKAKRDGMMTDSLKKIVDEVQDERDSLRKEKKENEERYEKRILALEQKTDKLERRDAIKVRAIGAAYRCRLPEEISDCPVLQTLSEECEKNEGVCKIK